MKKQLLLILTLLIALSSPLIAQGTAINSTGTEADASAILDVSSTNQGFLLPRMTAGEKVAISSPATGLMIFQTDGTVGLYMYDGSSWKLISTESTTAVLTTAAASSISSTSATSGGNITDDGGKTITSRGVCWSTSQIPTVANDTTSDGSGTGSFSSSITGLSAGTTYYVRAFARTNIGVSYGDQINFTTSSLSTPTVTTVSVVEQFIAGNYRYDSGLNVTSEGTSPITKRGFVCGPSDDPVINGTNVLDLYPSEDPGGTGSLVLYPYGAYILANIGGLTSPQTVYFRAYATNSSGTSYGDTISMSVREQKKPNVNCVKKRNRMNTFLIKLL